jgi:hypothetical protein
MPFFRKVHKLKSYTEESDIIHIVSAKDLHARMKRHEPYLTPFISPQIVSPQYLDPAFGDGGGGVIV